MPDQSKQQHLARNIRGYNVYLVQVAGGQVSAPSSWKSNAGGALSKQGNPAEPKEQHKKAPSSHAATASYNKFAKFSAISGADALWKQAAEQLAIYAAQVPILSQSFHALITASIVLQALMCF